MHTDSFQPKPIHGGMNKEILEELHHVIEGLEVLEDESTTSSIARLIPSSFAAFITNLSSTFELHTDVSMDNPQICSWIMKTIFERVHKQNLRLTSHYWIRFFKVVMRALQAKSPHICDAITGLLVQSLRYSKQLPEILFVLEHADFTSIPVPEPITKLLASDLVAHTSEKISPSSSYHSPSHIIIANFHLVHPHFLRGWVSLTNQIVVNRSMIAKISGDNMSQCAILDLFSLIGQLSMYASVRRKLRSYSIHIPENCMVDFVPVDQVGKRWEIAFWGGLWPMWYSPIRYEEAENMAATIVSHGSNLSRLTKHQASLLSYCVGDRRNFHGNVADNTPFDMLPIHRPQSARA